MPPASRPPHRGAEGRHAPVGRGGIARLEEDFPALKEARIDAGHPRGKEDAGVPQDLVAPGGEAAADVRKVQLQRPLGEGLVARPVSAEREHAIFGSGRILGQLLTDLHFGAFKFPRCVVCRGMHMLHVRDLLAQVFVAKGFHVEEGPMGGLLARAPGETLLVEWKGDGPATSADVRALAGVLGPCGAHRAVLVAAAGAPPGVVHEATHLKIETWSLSRAALEVGLAALDAAQEGHVDPAPAEVPHAAPSTPTMVPTTQPSAATSPIHHKHTTPKTLIATAMSVASSPTGAVFLPSKPREVKQESRSLPSAWDVASGSARMPATLEIRPTGTKAKTVVAHDNPDAEIVGGSKVKKPASAPGVKAVPLLPDGATLRAKLGGQDAAAHATGLGRIQSGKLTLVPHIAFDFDCRVEHEALPQPIEAKGTLLINTITGAMRELPALDLGEAPKDAEKLAQRLQALDVYDRVKGHLFKLTTREVKIEKEVGGSTVMGTEKIGPGSPDELGLQHRGIVLVPIWHLVGEHGSMDIDAVTGEVAPAK